MESWPKVLRDPVHNLIPFRRTRVDKLILRLINCKELQRLRRIKQLGFSDLVYPGANHNRLAHSIGVMHSARLIMSALRANGADINVNQKIVVTLAALLHDIGHGPFSHAFEKVAKQDHERWTEAIIGDTSTEVNRLLSEIEPEMPSKISSFLNKEAPTEGWPVGLTHVVSSQLDADRMDYLLRDSFMTGARVGHFDQAWLIRTLCLSQDGEIVYVNKKGSDAVEDYIFARYHMFRTVYFHKTTRSAEVMFRKLLERIKYCLANGSAMNSIIPNAPNILEGAIKGELDLENYIRFDETTMWELIRLGLDAKDEIIKHYAYGLLYRKLFKAIEMPEEPESFEKIGEFRTEVAGVLKGMGFEPGWFLLEDTASDTPFRMYDPQTGKQVTNIYVEDAGGSLRPLQDVCPPLKTLPKIRKIRCYVPLGARDAAVALCKKILYN